jgi:hypothetical protein
MSSSSQVKLDYDALSDLESHLTNALNVLGMDIESSATIAVASGDTRLGARVLEFNRSWNKHRYDIKDQLTWLRDSVKNIAAQFEETDKTLASGISGGGGGGGGGGGR